MFYPLKVKVIVLGILLYYYFTQGIIVLLYSVTILFHLENEMCTNPFVVANNSHSQ